MLAAALKAARRVNDFPTAVRIFEGTRKPLIPSYPCSLALRLRHISHPAALTFLAETTGIKAKVENKGQYQQYLEELKPLREELGILLKEDMYPEEKP